MVCFPGQSCVFSRLSTLCLSLYSSLHWIPFLLLSRWYVCLGILGPFPAFPTSMTLHFFRKLNHIRNPRDLRNLTSQVIWSLRLGWPINLKKHPGTHGFSYYEISLPTKRQQSKPRSGHVFTPSFARPWSWWCFKQLPRPTEFSKLEPEHLPPQDYLEATKPTDIIPQPKKNNRNNYTRTLKTSNSSSPRNQQQKTTTPFPPSKHPQKKWADLFMTSRIWSRTAAWLQNFIGFIKLAAEV